MKTSILLTFKKSVKNTVRNRRASANVKLKIIYPNSDLDPFKSFQNVASEAGKIVRAAVRAV